ncbi:hypothetical protein CIHG_00187 [Coccidioides immitis H538.4]|uniref:Uncharacterized protein n=2 Tax=Coccidioides immitis TaxID=5501 RepID=A0A0J8REM0_COCIT|nr:hypothetical protein CIRG_07006 [Coccidioides immitis RMSCC 2394]KMU82404.1 hypothetical protein CIHG_00187 [Coccidioides immitis H538.4]
MEVQKLRSGANERIFDREERKTSLDLTGNAKAYDRLSHGNGSQLAGSVASAAADRDAAEAVEWRSASSRQAQKRSTYIHTYMHAYFFAYLCDAIGRAANSGFTPDSWTTKRRGTRGSGWTLFSPLIDIVSVFEFSNPVNSSSAFDCRNTRIYTQYIHTVTSLHQVHTTPAIVANDANNETRERTSPTLALYSTCRRLTTARRESSHMPVSLASRAPLFMTFYCRLEIIGSALEDLKTVNPPTSSGLKQGCDQSDRLPDCDALIRLCLAIKCKAAATTRQPEWPQFPYSRRTAEPAAEA